jgi:hypothetical protein
MNIIQETRQSIISTNNTAQKQFESFIAHLDPERTTSIDVTISLHGNLDLAILKSAGFRNLRSLSFSEGEITNLSNLPPTLEKLSCTHQYLVDLENLPASIRELDLQHNYLKTIDLSACPKLRVLQISHNQMTTIDHLPETLEELYCDNNEIHLLNLRDTTKLRVLHTSNNKTLIIEAFPPSVVDFRSENNPFLDIQRAQHAGEAGAGETASGGSPNISAESADKLNFMESIHDYFKLKTQYETSYYNARKTAFRKAYNNRKQGRKFAQQVLPKCVNCRRPVGTIFELKNRTYTAICGDKDKPCNLKIQLYAGKFYENEQTLYMIHERLTEIKDEIIKQKLDTLFSFISSKDSAKLFKDIMEEYTYYNSQFSEIMDTHNLCFYKDQQRIDAIAKKRAVIYGIIDAIKELIVEYEKTGNRDLLQAAIQIQVKELNPEIHNLRLLNYEVMEMDVESKKQGGGFGDGDEDGAAAAPEGQAGSFGQYTSTLVQRYVTLPKYEYNIDKAPHVIHFTHA